MQVVLGDWKEKSVKKNDKDEVGGMKQEL